MEPHKSESTRWDEKQNESRKQDEQDKDGHSTYIEWDEIFLIYSPDIQTQGFYVRSTNDLKKARSPNANPLFFQRPGKNEWFREVSMALRKYGGRGDTIWFAFIKTNQTKFTPL